MPSINSDWWYSGPDLLLKGVEGDDSNPPRLDSDSIYEFLLQFPESREGLLDTLPLLLPEERERIQGLIDAYPAVMVEDPHKDDKAMADALSANWNKKVPAMWDLNRGR